MNTLEARLTSPLGFAAVVAASILLWLVALTGATSADNNRGTVKIHDTTAGQEVTDPSDKRNEPTVCDYTLHWFGGNPGEIRGWWVEAWPRDADAAPADVGMYTSDEEGNAQAAQSHRLADGHYKLFWESSDGHTKHKVFKVNCADDGGGGGGEG
jgi:hypothetical protein